MLLQLFQILYLTRTIMPPTKWLTHVKKTYAEMKKKNPKATLMDAMKAAKMTYKK